MSNKHKIAALQIDMMQKLLNGESVNVQKLEGEYKHEVPERTIRDKITKVIEPLFPDSIYNEKGIGWISKDNLNEKTILTAPELIALQTLKNYALGLDKDISTSALKLLSKFEQGVFAHEIIHRTKKEKLDKDNETTITVLMNAIRQKKKVSCTYNDKQRIIEPLMIVMLEGYWYLHLFDINKETGLKKAKNFHIKTIELISLLDETFEYPEISFFKKLKTSVNAFFDSESDYISVELLLHKEIVKYFRRIPISTKQKIYGSKDDEYMTLSVEVTNLKEVAPIIQQYLPDIKVVHPSELNEIIKKNISDYAVFKQKDEQIPN